MGDKRQRVSDYDIESDNTHYAQLEFKEKGWKKHQRIATEASIASATLKPNIPMSPSIASSMTSTAQTIIDRDKSLKHYQHKNVHRKNKKLKGGFHTRTETEKTNEYNGYIDYHSDSDDFGVFDIADFAKQIKSTPNKQSASCQYEQHKKNYPKNREKNKKKNEKKEKKRLEKERKRKLKEKELEIEEIERRMYAKKEESKKSKSRQSTSSYKSNKSN